MNQSFLIIDDSDLDRFIVNKLINHIGKPARVDIFINGKLAFDHIKDNTLLGLERPAIVFLDVQMPLMTGFEFVEQFEQLPAPIQEQYYLVALSSSMNKSDMIKMNTYRAVKKVLEKPITMETLLAVLENASPNFIVNRI